jgi:hypothetical protein
MAFYDRSEFLVRITNLKFLLTGEYLLPVTSNSLYKQ